MSVKRYLLFCEYCAYRRITDGSDASDLHEVKRAPLMTGVPKWNPIEQKTETTAPRKRKRLFKCPKCGRASLFPRKLNLQEDTNEESNTSGHQAGDEGQEVQGKPSP